MSPQEKNGARPDESQVKEEDGTVQAASEQEAPEQPPEAGEESPQSSGETSAEAAEMRDRYLRLAAEYDNFRKRTERERSEAWNRAQAEIVQRLLEPLDDLQRVAGLQPDTTPTATLMEGVQMVERKLARVLENAGLQAVEAEGKPFDPSLHEALMTAPAESPEEDDLVADVFQQGYEFKGALLRPARVRVKKFQG